MQEVPRIPLVSIQDWINTLPRPTLNYLGKTMDELVHYRKWNRAICSALDPHIHRLSALADFLKDVFGETEDPPAFNDIQWIIVPMAHPEGRADYRHRELYSAIIVIDIDVPGRVPQGW